MSTIVRAHIPADRGNAGFDVLGYSLSNPGGYVNNGSCKTIQSPTAWQLLDKVVYGGVDFVIEGAAVNGRAKYKRDGVNDYFQYDGSANWEYYVDGVQTETVASTSPYPSKTGWSGSVVLVWASERIDDDGTRKALSLSEELALVNGADNNLNQFVKAGVNNTCLLKEQIHYAQGTTDGWTEAQLVHAGRWANNSLNCGAGIIEFVVHNGVYVTHNGNQVFN